MTTRSHLAGLAAAMLVSACASSPRVCPDEVIDLGPTRGERYAAALRQTLDIYEGEVVTAYLQTYPSFEDAYRVARRLGDPELTSILERRLESQGLTLEGLNQYAAEHPEWLREQNRLHSQRMKATRGTAFAIMARYERSGDDRDDTLQVPAEPAPATVTQLVGR